MPLGRSHESAHQTPFYSGETLTPGASAELDSSLHPTSSENTLMCTFSCPHPAPPLPATGAARSTLEGRCALYARRRARALRMWTTSRALTRPGFTPGA